MKDEIKISKKYKKFVNSLYEISQKRLELKRDIFQLNFDSIVGHDTPQEFADKMQVPENTYYRLKKGVYKHNLRTIVPIPILYGATPEKAFRFLESAGIVLNPQDHDDRILIYLILNNADEKDGEEMDIEKLNKKLDELGYTRNKFGSMERREKPLRDRTGKIYK